MNKFLRYKYLFFFLLINIISNSQVFDSKITIYEIDTQNIISIEFQKELEIFFNYYHMRKDAVLTFNAVNCDDKKFTGLILGTEDMLDKNFIKGIFFFHDKTIYLGADSNVYCKFKLFLKKSKDTLITLLNNYSNDIYDYENIEFDDNGPYFYWTNFIINDTIMVKIPVVEPIKEYDLSGYYKKRWYPFTKSTITSTKRIKLKEKFDKTQLIYFVYTIEHGVPVYFYSFYSMDESNTDNLVVLILNNFNKNKRLKDEKYMGKAYSDGKYFIIDYTYLSIIR